MRSIPWASGLLLCVGAISGLALGYVHWRRTGPSHFDARTAVILDQARSFPPGGVVVFGDSLVERQRLTMLCGLPVLNAGVSGARITDVAAFAEQVASAARPSLSIVAVGTNDVIQGPAPTWLADYRVLLAGIGPSVRAIVGIGLAHQNQAAVAMDKVLRREARDRHIRFIEALPAKPGLFLDDGVHHSAAGKAIWQANLAAICAS